jgi:hypothetical protein
MNIAFLLPREIERFDLRRTLHAMAGSSHILSRFSALCQKQSQRMGEIGFAVFLKYHLSRQNDVVFM